MLNMREYEVTHKWINFTLNLGTAPYTLWLLLGAAESKCKHLAGIPLRPEKQKELNQVSLIKGVQATTAIEGNTLTMEEVGEIISRGSQFRMPKSYEYRQQEIQNMLEAYNLAINEIDKLGSCRISLETLREDNALILRNLELPKDITPGKIREYSVVVGHYRGAPAEDCEYLLQRLFEWLTEDWRLGETHKLVEGILKAIVSHLYIAWIHPFSDGNGRAARMLEFRMLMNAGVPLTAAHLLTSYYNETRSQYYTTLAASSAYENGVVDFVQYSLQGFVDALDGQIKEILEEQLNVTWENYVHKSCFGGKLTSALRRRRDLLLEISNFKYPVLVKELRARLSVQLLKLYQDKPRMLMRDINYLEEMNLLERTREGYYATKEQMKAFLPLVKH